MDPYDYEQIKMLKEYNETFNDRVHKYTLNIPNELFEKAKARARSVGIYRLSIYFRAIIEREVNGKSGLTMDEIISARKDFEISDPREYRRETEKEENLPLPWKRNLKKFLDTINDRQLYFFPVRKSNKLFEQ